METNVLVYGAYGHTGRFVVAELLQRGLTPVLSGRDPARLAAMTSQFPGLETRPATIDSTHSMMNGIRDASLIINCAGPFLDTAIPVATAAVRAGAHYLDVAAEQGVVQELYRAGQERGWPVSVAVIPAMAFYGGLADLLATAAMDGWDAADEITVASGLDRWWPTEGTRDTGRRSTATRHVVTGGRLVPVPSPAPVRDWDFPAPLGTRPVAAFPLSEIITIGHHLTAASISAYLTTTALDDLHDPATPAPPAVDAAGRSAQQFIVNVVIRRDGQERRISAAGRDIYAITAPLIAEAAVRLLDGRARLRGAAAPGEVFDAADFLSALSPDHLTVHRDGLPEPGNVEAS